MVQIAPAAATVLNAPVNGPAQHSGMLGYHHCSVVNQAVSGLSEELDLKASALTLMIAVVSALPEMHSYQPASLTIPQRQTETDQCPA